MANQQAKRDDNRVPGLLIHDSTGAETRQVRATAANPNALPVASVSSTASALDHGSNLDVDGTAEALTSTSFAATNGVTLVADETNTGTIYVGNSDVTAGTTAGTDGLPLYPGGSLTTYIDNPNKLYVIASVANQKIYWYAE